MEKPPYKRIWYACPYCGKRLFIYDNTALVKGVYIKCKGCNKEIKVQIKVH